MKITITCSWCHAVNDSFERWCKACGHSAWLPRSDCDCRRCMGALLVTVPPGSAEPEQLPLPRAVRQLLGDRDLGDDPDDE